MSRPVLLLIRTDGTETTRRRFSAACDAMFLFGDLVHRFPDRFGPTGSERLLVLDAADLPKQVTL